MVEVCEVIDECPDDKSPVVMEDFANRNLDDLTRNFLNEINEIGVDEEVVEKIHIENEDVIHRDVTKNEPETNRYTLKNITEEFPDDQDGEEKGKTAENENEGIIHRDITEN